jgi:heme oxygenase
MRRVNMLTPAGLHNISGMAAYPAAAGLRLCLRSVTAEAHARLDARRGALDLTSLPDYRRFLEASAAALLPLEAALAAAQVVAIFPDWELRSRQAAILEDLARIGGHLEPLPAPGPLDFGGVLGTMYVLEACRLDARVLLNAVKRSTDARVLHATAFLRHGAGHQFWPSFLMILESHADADHEASAIDGAMQAFATFERAAAWHQSKSSAEGGGALASPPSR